VTKINRALLIVMALALLTASKADAEFVTSLQDVGANVVVTGSGSLDLTDLVLSGIGASYTAGICLAVHGCS